MRLFQHVLVIGSILSSDKGARRTVYASEIVYEIFGSAVIIYLITKKLKILFIGSVKLS